VKVTISFKSQSRYNSIFKFILVLHHNKKGWGGGGAYIQKCFVCMPPMYAFSRQKYVCWNTSRSYEVLTGKPMLGIVLIVSWKILNPKNLVEKIVAHNHWRFLLYSAWGQEQESCRKIGSVPVDRNRLLSFKSTLCFS